VGYKDDVPKGARSSKAIKKIHQLAQKAAIGHAININNNNQTIE